MELIKPSGGFPTLADVAQATGVSVPTVSRALRGSSEIGRATTARVRAVADQLGYLGSPAGRALRTGLHNAIGFTLPLRDIGWWERLIKGACEAATELGYSVVLYPSGDQEGSPAGLAATRSVSEIIRSLSASPVDALVLVTPGSKDWLDDYSAGGKPVLVIDDTAHYSGIRSFSSDNYEGGRLAVRHLVESGRNRLICVNPRQAIGEKVATDRIRGFLDEADYLGVDAWVIDTQETYPVSLVESDAVLDAQRRGIEFDGVFCLADFAAPAVFRSLLAAGRSIPADVSVIGFDNDQVGLALSPTLTTVSQPLEQMGSKAIRQAVACIQQSSPAIEEHILPTEVIQRGSS